jgi:hypothetical protein
VHDVVSAAVLLLVHNGAHAPVVVAASHHGQVAQVKLWAGGFDLGCGAGQADRSDSRGGRQKESKVVCGQCAKEGPQKTPPTLRT